MNHESYLEQAGHPDVQCFLYSAQTSADSAGPLEALFGVFGGMIVDPSSTLVEVHLATALYRSLMLGISFVAFCSPVFRVAH